MCWACWRCSTRHRRAPVLEMSGLETMVTNLVIAESQHEAIEEQFFWPAVRAALDDGDALADKAIEQEQDGKQLLQRLADGKPGEPDYHEALREFVKVGTRTHRLRAGCRVATIRSRGEPRGAGKDRVERLERCQEDRARPVRTPALRRAPSVLKTTGMVAATVDHVRDAVTGRAADNPPDPQIH